MISFTVRLTFDAADRKAVEDAIHLLTPASRAEAGCVSYFPHFVEGEPATLLIYEQYKDEAALDHHRNSPHFQQYAANGIYKLKHTRQLERLIALD